MKIPTNHLTPIKLKIGLVLFGLTVICMMFLASCKDENQINFGINYVGTEYSLKILDEHKVLCISATNDTIILSFENAYALSEETVIFIKK